MQRIYIDSNNQEKAIYQAVEILRSGGLVIYPTETVYGVAVDATNSQAVNKLLQYKNRPAGKAISVMVSDKKTASKLVEINAVADNIYNNFLPGPVTVVSKYNGKDSQNIPKNNSGRIDPRLLSELGGLGIRISSHIIPQQIAKIFNRPFTATSANASGKGRPYNIDQLLNGLSEKQIKLIDIIIDIGELPKNDPSTVIDTTQNVQTILRSGEYFEKIVPACASKSEEDTVLFANRFAHSILHYLSYKPVIITLNGEMGAGKTHFAKGVGAALGVKKIITSPTFNLIKEYEGSTLADLSGCTEENICNQQVGLIHIDLWRIDNINPEELEIDSYWKIGNVLIIEWPSPIMEYLEQNKAQFIWFKVDFNLELNEASSRKIYIQKGDLNE